MKDDMIDALIESRGAFGSNPTKPRYVGFDWNRTDKLKPTGDAGRDRVLSETLSPKDGLR